MDQSKTLIVGAGIAGLTLAALMKKRGQEAVIIEKQGPKKFKEAGYMLGLLPLGGRVLNALGIQADYLAASCAMEVYRIYDGRGRKMNSYSLKEINERFGPYRGIKRGKLISLLQKAAGDPPVQYSTTVKALDRDDAKVTVTFSDDTIARFDLVVIADGLHSTTRLQVLNNDEITYQQTGWGGWVTWIDADPDYANAYHEYWGAGSFLGLYPVKNQIGAFIGGPVNQLKKRGRKAFVEKMQHNFEGPVAPVQEALRSFKEKEDPYFWDFHDCKTKCWKKGRVVLLGDAATGFLPTAGIGASMAMDAAAALDDELSRAGKGHLKYALQLYENRQRDKVEKAQQASRYLGTWMFVDSAPKAWLRNKLIRFYSLERMLKEFENVMLGR